MRTRGGTSEEKPGFRQSFLESGVGLFPVEDLSKKSALEEFPSQAPCQLVLYQMINQAFQGQENGEGPIRTP